MLGLLDSILCVVRQIAYMALWAIISAVNAIVVGLAAAVEALVALLPEFPDPPETPATVELVLGWISWAFPVGTVIEIVAWLLVVWLAYIGVSTVLRWAKVVE